MIWWILCGFELSFVLLLHCPLINPSRIDCTLFVPALISLARLRVLCHLVVWFETAPSGNQQASDMHGQPQHLPGGLLLKMTLSIPQLVASNHFLYQENHNIFLSTFLETLVPGTYYAIMTFARRTATCVSIFQQPRYILELNFLLTPSEDRIQYQVLVCMCLYLFLGCILTHPEVSPCVVTFWLIFLNRSDFLWFRPPDYWGQLSLVQFLPSACSCSYIRKEFFLRRIWLAENTRALVSKNRWQSTSTKNW